MLLVGLKVAVTPEGIPVAVKATDPLKPFWSATVIAAIEFAPPATIDIVGVELDNVKLGAAIIVKAIAVVALNFPDVPVTFMT